MDITPKGYSLTEIVAGMSAHYTQTITDTEIKIYAGLSGDNNPVHMDDEYAASSKFGARIAHGMISSSFFSKLFGTTLPGPGCVYVSQTLRFKRPVYIGDTVTAIITVEDVDNKKHIVTFSTICKVKGKVVIAGSAELYVP